MAQRFDYDKLKKPNKSVWITKCRICKIPTSKGFYCARHRKRSGMNKWEWFLKYGLDKEIQKIKSSNLRDTMAVHEPTSPRANGKP